MVPAEFVAQDHAYRMLKQRIYMQPIAWIAPINIVVLAESLSLSRTPVREALFRLMGEGVIEPAHPGSYRLYRPAADMLGELYLWSQHLMLTIIAVVPRADLLACLNGLQGRRPEPFLDEQLWQIPLIFQALGDATRNREMGRQLSNLNERLIGVRLAEAKLFTDGTDEVRRLVSTADPDVKNSMRRKIITHHRRRIQQAAAISEAFENMRG